jgi:hypothetical protein
MYNIIGTGRSQRKHCFAGFWWDKCLTGWKGVNRGVASVKKIITLFSDNIYNSVSKFFTGVAYFCHLKCFVAILWLRS